MALSIPRLAADIFAKLKARYRTDPGGVRNRDAFLSGLATDLATAIVTEVTGNAKCTGTDSHGDTHDNVGII